MIVPLGGGGLAVGVAIALKQADPSIKVIGVQVEVCAPYANLPFPAGPVITLADGIAVKRPGAVTRPLVDHWLDDVVVVDEDAVADAMVHADGASQALRRGRRGGRGRRAAVRARRAVSYGRDVCAPERRQRRPRDACRASSAATRPPPAGGSSCSPRSAIDRADWPDCCSIFAQEGANLIAVEHVREGVDLHVRETGVQVVLEVKGADHAADVIAAARAAGYDVTPVSRN